MGGAAATSYDVTGHDGVAGDVDVDNRGDLQQ
jgi:hypothetical protein